MANILARSCRSSSSMRCKCLIVQHMKPNKFLLTSAVHAFDLSTKDAQRQSETRKAKQEAFLATIRHGWVKAMEAAGCRHSDVQRWKRLDPDFALRLSEVDAETASELEGIADAIARGEQDATPTQMQALQFRLKALRPDIYRERSSVQVDQRTTVSIEGDSSRARMLLAEWTG